MGASLRRRLRVGCSGWNYPHWRGTFYPDGLPERRWLEHYAERFETVEVNATFYRLPTRKTVGQWAQTTPDGFVFSVKASRYLTHVRRLRDIGAGVSRMMERLEPLSDASKLGPILWQLPPNLPRDDDKLAAALPLLPDTANAFEFRHASWDAPAVMELLRSHGIGFTIADSRKQPPPPVTTTAPFAYVRFHFGRRGRRGNYSARELEGWATRLAKLRAREIFAYFNNDWEAFAPRNAVLLGEIAS